MIKKLILAMMVVFGLSISAMAQDVVQFSGLNLAGDTIYLPSSGSFAVGIGSDIATVYDFVTIRGEYVDPMNEGVGHKVGLGAGINIQKLIDKTGGIWLLKDISVSGGVMGLANLDGDVHLEPALFLSVITFIK